MKGFSGLPVDYQKAVKQMGDSLFLHTSYSFHSAVKRTMEYAITMKRVICSVVK